MQELEADPWEGVAQVELQDQAWGSHHRRRMMGRRCKMSPGKKGTQMKCHLCLQDVVTCINYTSDLLLEASQAVPTHPPD